MTQKLISKKWNLLFRKQKLVFTKTYLMLLVKGQQEIKCLIENTAKDQEIARLNRVVDAQRDQNIINSVVQALGNKTA